MIISLIGVIGGVIEGVLASSGIICPVWLFIVTGCCVGIPPAITAFLTGKNPNLTKKTKAQIAKQMNIDVPK